MYHNQLIENEPANQYLHGHLGSCSWTSAARLLESEAFIFIYVVHFNVGVRVSAMILEEGTAVERRRSGFGSDESTLARASKER